MSFDRRNPDHCPTCDTTEPCVHRGTRGAHVAYREGRDAFLIPYSNREPIDSTNPYGEETDLGCWWSRGFQGEARKLYCSEWKARAEAAERESDRLRHGVPVEGDFVCPNELYRAKVEPLIEAVLSFGRQEPDHDAPNCECMQCLPYRAHMALLAATKAAG